MSNGLKRVEAEDAPPQPIKRCEKCGKPIRECWCFAETQPANRRKVVQEAYVAGIDRADSVVQGEPPSEWQVELAKVTGLGHEITPREAAEYIAGAMNIICELREQLQGGEFGAAVQGEPPRGNCNTPHHFLGPVSDDRKSLIQISHEKSEFCRDWVVRGEQPEKVSAVQEHWTNQKEMAVQGESQPAPKWPEPGAPPRAEKPPLGQIKTDWQSAYYTLWEELDQQQHRAAAAERRVRELEAELADSKKDAEGWKREFNMYRSAWLREIGGTIANKHHEIDGFVLRTREIYEKSRKWDTQQQLTEMRLRDAFHDVPDPGPVPDRDKRLEFEIKLRGHKFNRAEFAVPMALPAETIMQIVELFYPGPASSADATALKTVASEAPLKQSGEIGSQSPHALPPHVVTIFKERELQRAWEAGRDAAASRLGELDANTSSPIIQRKREVYIEAIRALAYPSPVPDQKEESK